MNQQQKELLEFKLRNAMVEVFSTFVPYSGQIEDYSRKQANRLMTHFVQFVQKDIYKQKQKQEHQ